MPFLMTFLISFLIVLGVPIGNAGSAEDIVLLDSGGIVVTEQDLQHQLQLLSETDRAKVLAGSDQIKQALRQIYQYKYMAAEAMRLGLSNDPTVQARLAVEQRQVLVDALRGYTEKQIQSPNFSELAQEHYASHRSEFQLPGQFKVAHILKKVQCDCERQNKQQAIEKLLTRIRAGEDFAALAKSESEDSFSATRGGDLGRWVKREELEPAIASTMEKLEIGQVSGVVETKYGFHLIKLVDHQPARLQTFDEVEKNIEQRLRQTYVQNQLGQKAQDYLPPADAKFDESALHDLVKEH